MKLTKLQLSCIDKAICYANKNRSINNKKDIDIYELIFRYKSLREVSVEEQEFIYKVLATKLDIEDYSNEVFNVKKFRPRIYGYCRVSTTKQLEGNGLEAQEQEILKKYPHAEIIREQYTGSKIDRPIFNTLLQQLHEGDTVVITKLDRLARNTKEGISIVEDFFSRKIAIHVLNIGLLENTAMGRFFLTTLLAVAEMERSMIIERTQAGKEIAKQDPSFKDGRPRIHNDKKLNLALEMLEHKTLKEVSSTLQVSVSTIKRYRNKKREKTSET